MARGLTLSYSTILGWVFPPVPHPLSQLKALWPHCLAPDVCLAHSHRCKQWGFTRAPHAVQAYIYVYIYHYYLLLEDLKVNTLSFKHPVTYQNAALHHVIASHKQPMLIREVSEESEHCWPSYWPGPAVPVSGSLWALNRKKKETLWRHDMAVLRNVS